MEGLSEQKRRKIPNNTQVELLARCGGRCTMCNEDVMNDYFTGKRTHIFEKAHIKAFSDWGPRGCSDIPDKDRNAADNLIILCPSCHTKIDKDSESYSVEFLKNMKKDKEERVQRGLDLAGGDECTIVRYTSAIGQVTHTFNEEDIRRSLLKNGFYSKDGVINLDESNDEEDIQSSIRTVDKLFESRISRSIINGQSKPFCLFALAPQPLLIYLGWKFDDLADVRVFIKHRNGWKYNENSSRIRNFTTVEPVEQNVDNDVILVLGITYDANAEIINNCFGENVDVWKIKLSDDSTGTDLISNKFELDGFKRTVVDVLDKIGQIYGKSKVISVIPIVSNALAVEFGRAYMKKSQNPLRIHDLRISEGLHRYEYSLSIPP